jgi:sec-independent protein translocase protein TatB
MFEIAWSELFIVLIVAIIVVGPKELPGMLRGFGRIIGKLRRSADDFRRQFEESMREAGGDDLTRELNELRRHNPLNEIRNTIEDAAREVSNPSLASPASSGDKPSSSAEPPAIHETFTEPEVRPELPAPAAQAAPPAPPPSPEPAPAEPAKEPQVTPGHGPVVNGQHRPLS